MKTVQFETTMRRAFLKAALSNVDKGIHSPLVRTVADYATRGSGESKVPSWNAKLSLRTYESLKRAGVMH